jgi:hypothetical protein
MKLNFKQKIDASLETVWAAFNNSANKERWQQNFESIGEDKTRWTSWCNFSFKGFMKIMALFISGTIRKRTEGDMHRFKLMVETDAAGRA